MGSVLAMLAGEQLLFHPQLIFMVTGHAIADFFGGKLVMLLMLNMIVSFDGQILQGTNVKSFTKA